MKKLICLCLAAMFALLPLISLAEGKAEKVQESMFLFEGEKEGYYYAKIENTGDAPIVAGYSTLDFFTAEKEESILTVKYITTYPRDIYLEPGEYAYLYKWLYDDILKNEKVDSYQFTVENKNRGYDYKTLSCLPAFCFKGVNERGYVDSDENYINVTFTNTTDEIVNGFEITVAFYDGEGCLIYVDSNTYSSFAVHPGSTVTVTSTIKNALVKYFSAQGITPAVIDAVVYY